MNTEHINRTEMENLQKTIIALKEKYHFGEFTQNEATQKEYIRMFKRLKNKGQSVDDLLEAAKNTTSKNTWYKRRAAIRLCSFAAINALMNKIVKNINHQKPLGSEMIDIQFYIDLLQNLPDTCPIVFKAKRNSKKETIKPLPDAWREQVIAEVNKKYRLEVLLLAATGCRPEEIAKGIDAMVTDKKLILRIQTAKVKDGKIVTSKEKKLVPYLAGQEIRELIFNINSGNIFMKDLFKIFQENYNKNNQPELNSYFRVNPNNIDKKTLASAITRAGKRCMFEGLEQNITPYCFRHQLAVDLKSLGVNGDIIAMMLGHAVDTTKGQYGFIKRSKDAQSKVPTGVTTQLRLKDKNSINIVKKGHVLKDASILLNSSPTAQASSQSTAHPNAQPTTTAMSASKTAIAQSAASNTVNLNSKTTVSKASNNQSAQEINSSGVENTDNELDFEPPKPRRPKI